MPRFGIRFSLTSINADPRLTSGSGDSGSDANRSALLTLEAPVSSAANQLIDQFSALYPFPLDEFQREAIGTLIGDRSVMVAAPTGTGKTIVAEYGVYKAFERTGRVFYTTPIKALSNQKFRDLRAVYGDQVGLLTGDVSENRDARVVVMTTEVLRNMLLQSPWDVDDVDIVIFDEIHFLADQERGTTWEESIILCPDHIQLICLSATVTNADEIASWISRTHRPIRLITHFERAVPLALYYFTDRELHMVIDHTGDQIRDFPRSGGEARKQVGRGTGRRRADSNGSEGLDEPQPHEIIDSLIAGDMLPAIYFLFSRNDCQVFAERLAMLRPNLVTDVQLKAIESTLNTYLSSLRPEDRELEQVQLVSALARKGIGFHHAGLLPMLKQLVELLFSRGLMQVVFATDTLALGVNMPARSVVIGRMSKWDGRRRRVLIPNEFQQMAGRAGRRGMDAFGHVVVPYSPWLPFREMLEIATGPLEPVRSAFAVRYNTVLNLWDPPDGDRVRQMLEQSLAQFQTSQRIRLLEDDVIEIGGDIAGIPNGCLIGLDGGDELLEDYRMLISTLQTSEQKLRRLEEERERIESAIEASPWPEPGRQTLRRVLRTAPVGLVVHERELGWGVFLGKAISGIGSFFFDREVHVLPEYRQIDYVTDGRVVDLSTAAAELTSTEDKGKKLSLKESRIIQKQLKAMDLPDLEAMREEHRLRETDRVEQEIARLEETFQDAIDQRESLIATRDSHPCHRCPVRKEHRNHLHRIDKLERERNTLQQILEREQEAEDARIRGVIRGIREVLDRFGYMHRGYPTAKADMLAAVFDNDALILCELVDRGLLDRLTPHELAEVFSWFSFDRDFRYANHLVLPDALLSLRRRLEDIEHTILGEERDHGLFISEGHNPSFYGAAMAWASGQTMIEITEQIQLSEGDLVLTFNKTIDLLRQVREMLEDVLPDHPLRYSLRESERLLRRDIVEQSLTLGFAPILTDNEGEDAGGTGEQEDVAEEPDMPPKLSTTGKAASSSTAQSKKPRSKAKVEKELS